MNAMVLWYIDYIDIDINPYDPSVESKNKALPKTWHEPANGLTCRPTPKKGLAACDWKDPDQWKGLLKTCDPTSK